MRRNAKPRTNWPWVTTVTALAVVATSGAVLAWSRSDRGGAVEIELEGASASGGTIYVGEGVAVPGAYPFDTDDTIGGILKAAGGVKDGHDLSRLGLTITSNNDTRQRVDINRAEAWLLQALPGVGEVLAQRIVDYRQQNGPFANTSDLTRVSGLGKDTYNKIKDLITVYGY